MIWDFLRSKLDLGDGEILQMKIIWSFVKMNKNDFIFQFISINWESLLRTALLELEKKTSVLS